MGIYEDFTYNSCKTLQLVVLNLRDLWDHYLIFRKTPWDILRGEKHPNDEAQSPQSLTLDTIDNLESVFFWPGTEHGSLQTLHGVRTEGPAFPERLWKLGMEHRTRKTPQCQTHLCLPFWRIILMYFGSQKMAIQLVFAPAKFIFFD